VGIPPLTPKASKWPKDEPLRGEGRFWPTGFRYGTPWAAKYETGEFGGIGTPPPQWKLPGTYELRAGNNGSVAFTWARLGEPLVFPVYEEVFDTGPERFLWRCKNTPITGGMFEIVETFQFWSWGDPLGFEAEFGADKTLTVVVAPTPNPPPQWFALNTCRPRPGCWVP